MRTEKWLRLSLRNNKLNDNNQLNDYEEDYFKNCTCFRWYMPDLNAMAQSSENPRRIWLVAHACNCHYYLQTALEDGANGVEIDVNCPKKIDPKATYVDFSVAHNGYTSPEDRAEKNRKIKDPSVRWVSLKEYLNFEEMDKISLIWLDCKCKNPGQVFHLVKQVHNILIDRYGSKEAIPFSIIYGVYHMYTLRDPIGLDYSLAGGSFTPLIDWLRDNLWENEGTGLACEGPHGPFWTRETPDQLENFFDDHKFPKGKHFASQGTGLPFMTFFNMKMVNTLVELKKLKEQGRYCVRTGAWTLGKAEYGLYMIPSKNDCPPKSYGTECDLVLMDGRSQFIPARTFPSYDFWGVKKFVQRFFKGTGEYYSKYNRGHYVLAGNRWEDPFYK